jgi:hypothetical protein
MARKAKVARAKPVYIPGLFPQAERPNSTVLGDFQRSIREEPLHYIYKYKIFVVKDEVPAEAVISYLQKRYCETRRGNRYRVATYPHTSGNRYVDYILLETCTDEDLVYIKMRWGFSEKQIMRGERVKRRKLNKQQRKELDALLNEVKQRFYDNL